MEMANPTFGIFSVEALASMDQSQIQFIFLSVGVQMYIQIGSDIDLSCQREVGSVENRKRMERRKTREKVYQFIEQPIQIQWSDWPRGSISRFSVGGHLTALSVA